MHVGADGTPSPSAREALGTAGGVSLGVVPAGSAAGSPPAARQAR